MEPTTRPISSEHTEGSPAPCRAPDEEVRVAHDEDFASFASARWPALVRSGVVLGCNIDDAHDLAQTTLLRCFTAWRKVQAADDRDAYVYRVLLNCHRDSRRRRWWGEHPTATPPEQQTADLLGIAPGTVKSRLSRALAQLATNDHLQNLREGPHA